MMRAVASGSDVRLGHGRRNTYCDGLLPDRLVGSGGDLSVSRQRLRGLFELPDHEHLLEPVREEPRHRHR